MAPDALPGSPDSGAANAPRMPRMVNITRLASVIRSKNAGPYELTFDILFKDRSVYERVKRSGVINRELIAKLYKVPLDRVLKMVEFDPAMAIKATIVRPRPSGAIGESDVYGAQQHAPLLSIEIPWEGELPS